MWGKGQEGKERGVWLLFLGKRQRFHGLGQLQAGSKCLPMAFLCSLKNLFGQPWP